MGLYSHLLQLSLCEVLCNYFDVETQEIFEEGGRVIIDMLPMKCSYTELNVIRKLGCIGMEFW